MGKNGSSERKRPAWLLLVNVGNTRTTLALYRDRRIGARIRVPTEMGAGAGRRAMAALTRGRTLRGAALCSVVPAVEPRWRRLLHERIGEPPHVLGPDSPLGVRLDISRPKEVGPDRLADVAAAAACYGAPAIVVDAGTATTCNAIVRGRGFIGGAIAPGPSLFLDYLAERTARLPRLRVGGAIAPFGRTTVSAMRIGATVGYAGMLRALIGHLRRVPELAGAPVVITGGAGRVATEALGAAAIFDRDLTLIGIGLTADRVWNRMPSER